jgi:hypothetical protein
MFSKTWDTILRILSSAIRGAFIAALKIVPKSQIHEEMDSAHCDLSQFVATHYIAFQTSAEKRPQPTLL